LEKLARCARTRLSMEMARSRPSTAPAGGGESIVPLVLGEQSAHRCHEWGRSFEAGPLAAWRDKQQATERRAEAQREAQRARARARTKNQRRLGWSQRARAADGESAELRRAQQQREQRREQLRNAVPRFEVVRIDTVASEPLTPGRERRPSVVAPPPPKIDLRDPLNSWLWLIGRSFPRRYAHAFRAKGFGTMEALLQMRDKDVTLIRRMRPEHSVRIVAALADLRREHEARLAAAEAARLASLAAEAARLREWRAMAAEDAAMLELRARELAVAIERAARRRALEIAAAAKERHDRIWKGMTMAMYQAVHERQHAAVLLLQRRYRGARDRRRAVMMWVRHNAGDIARSCARKWLARQFVGARRSAYNAGALTLQRSWRGSKARGEVAELRRFGSLVQAVQCAWRTAVALRKAARQGRRRQAAAHRRADFEARQATAKRLWAVLLIAAVARGRMCREHLAKARAARERELVRRAIIRIRRNAMRRQRRRQKAEYQAARVVQKRARGWLARAYLRKVRDEIHRMELATRDLALRPKIEVTASGAWCPEKKAWCRDCGAGQFCKMRVKPLSEAWTYQELMSNASKVPPLPDIPDIEDLR